MDHLDENKIAQYVDALSADTKDQLPEEILEHVAECLDCKVAIMGVLPLVEAYDHPK